MLLVGAEINSEIEAAAAAKRLLVLEQKQLCGGDGFDGTNCYA